MSSMLLCRSVVRASQACLPDSHCLPSYWMCMFLMAICCYIKVVIEFRLAAITISTSMSPPHLLQPGCLQSCDACSGRRTRSQVLWMTILHQVPRRKPRRRQTSRLARAGRTTQNCGKLMWRASTSQQASHDLFRFSVVCTAANVMHNLP